MGKTSAGLLLFKVVEGDVHVLIAHPGGPFWANKDVGSWSIPKGEHDESDDAYEVACREFREELGSDPHRIGQEISLGAQRQPSGKTVSVWAVEGDFDHTTAVSNMFELEWPPGSGVMQEFPEVDRSRWFPVAVARTLLSKGQVVFLDRLMEHLAANRPS